MAIKHVKLHLLMEGPLISGSENDKSILQHITPQRLKSNQIFDYFFNSLLSLSARLYARFGCHPTPYTGTTLRPVKVPIDAVLVMAV
ncbi:hypothetical protein CEXT_186111 [Caerostris extrusa]|uniref:Uncharacterized protein n=1 Tax=Caerostris extrusa TaxID=172846 RepID=A0AAV4TU57_CAEEX|nr:hypothetical protein CEXT_186111 [Caerostris extrusa]